MVEADKAWIEALSLAMAGALDEFRERVADRIELLAVDCHPWHGSLDLAVLTSAEAKQDPSLCTPAEMAAWKFFHFSSGLASWQAEAELGQRMCRHYHQSTEEDRASVAEGYLRACAIALEAGVVQEAISRYELSEDFGLSVPHPDSDEEFYPPV